MTQVWDGNDLTGHERSQARPVAPHRDDAEAPHTSDFVIVGAGLVASVSISALGFWKLVELVAV